ncbi:MAG: hypothetical protein ACK58T_40840, partial [Phycisphaerae bacterium]
MLVTEMKEENGKNVSAVAAPTAVDLKGFGSRDWMKSVVLDYSAHFAWLKNAGWYSEAKAKSSAGEEVAFIDPDQSEMADWSGKSDVLRSPENEPAVKALVEFLAAEAGHGRVTVDAALVEKGRSIAVDGSWGGSLEGMSCSQCHESIGQEFAAVPDDQFTGSYPTMARYASAAWLKDFIRHPDAKRHYGNKNRMPAYSEQQLSETDLD